MRYVMPFSKIRIKDVPLVGGKTASLFATACQGGAVVAQEPEQWIEALRTYGYNFGMAFQITDDVLDAAASREIVLDRWLARPALEKVLERFCYLFRYWF